jgi:DNA helicase-2/ATP-dependent DNA helicase PcrA
LANFCLNLAERMTPDNRQYQAAFAEELARLNPAQREAVAQLEGPVLVIAGPGTGKTHILASRIGRILLETDAQAQNILCLTFTDAGVQAMRQRLLQLIGPEAHRVHIFTFHAFCNTVIQDNLAYFGRQQLEPLSELEQVEVLRTLLEDLPLTHPLRRGKVQPHFYEGHLKQLFEWIKAEGWTVEQLLDAIDTYLADLPNRQKYRYQRKHGRFVKGDLKESLYAQEKLRMEVLASGVRLFPHYEAALHRRSRYDYADMIRWVLAAFRENELLLRSYQEQYLYFLVDEYQDTNGAQNELIRRLAAYWEAPNLFIVGDDDQSIFEFQGARLKNLVDYYFDFREHIKVVLLQDNYRSNQPILDAAQALIQYNEQRITKQLQDLAVEKRLRAVHPDRQRQEEPPRLRIYANTFQESLGILQELEAQHAAGTPWREMAVIYARHQQVTQLQAMLDKAGIPYQTRRRTNILDTPLVRQLREWLRYLHDEQQQAFSGDHRLFKLLHSRALGLRSFDLARLSAYRAHLPYAERPHWRDWLQGGGAWPEDFTRQEELLRVGHWLEDLLVAVDQLSLPELLERLLHRTGLLRQLLQAPDRLWQVQVAKSLLDFVQAETARRPRLSLAQLLTTFDQMDSNRLSLPLRKDIELENGVQLVTAHSSKGLEFDCVFLLDASLQYWEPSRRNGGHKFSLPDTLTRSGETFAEETSRRLFYVAMTRARKRLYISYAREKANGKAQQACRFLDEIQASFPLRAEAISLPAEEVLARELQLLGREGRPQLPAMERSAIDKLLVGFQLSVSAWNRYLDCPLRFFYEVLLQAPQVQRPAATYGDAIHTALQRYFNQMLKQEDRQLGPVDELLRYFEEEMRQRRAFFTTDEYERRLAQGQHNLRLLHANQHTTWPRHCRTEIAIQQVEIAGVPVRGIIDRLDFLDNQEVRIVDYKTGSHKTERIRQPSPVRPEGGNYWRQLAFYQLLIENRPGERQAVRESQIVYLGLDKQGELPQASLRFTPDDLRQVQELLRSSYEQILAHDFYTGCGKDSCEWCAFVQEELSPPIHTTQAIEALDDRS